MRKNLSVIVSILFFVGVGFPLLLWADSSWILWHRYLVDSNMAAGTAVLMPFLSREEVAKGRLTPNLRYRSEGDCTSAIFGQGSAWKKELVPLGPDVKVKQVGNVVEITLGRGKNQWNAKAIYFCFPASEDPREANINALKRMAEMNDPVAQFDMGILYRQGKGVEKSYKEAAKWNLRAAEQGYAPAQYNLASMYLKGVGVPQSDAEAAKWFRDAAEQGHAKSQFNLAVMYQHGGGVTQNYVLAYKWFTLAAARGIDQAEKMRMSLAKKMTSDQIAEAQQLVKEWKPK